MQVILKWRVGSGFPITQFFICFLRADSSRISTEPTDRCHVSRSVNINEMSVNSERRRLWRMQKTTGVNSRPKASWQQHKTATCLPERRDAQVLQTIPQLRLKDKRCQRRRCPGVNNKLTSLSALCWESRRLCLTPSSLKCHSCTCTATYSMCVPAARMLQERVYPA